MPTNTVRIVDHDTGFARLEVDLKWLRGREIKVGIMGNETVDGVSVVDYATFNEFGTSRIPARPFMAETYARHGDDSAKFIEHMYNQLLEGGMNADHLLKTAGADYQSKVQKTIRDAKNWAEPNAESTKARKGSSSPLIDKSRMIGAVRYEVK